LLDVDRYRDTAGYQGHGEIQAEYRLNTGGTSQKYTPGEGFYTILPSLIVYGIWHKRGGSMARHILRNGRSVVLQQGRCCGWGGGNKRMIDSHKKALK